MKIDPARCKHLVPLDALSAASRAQIIDRARVSRHGVGSEVFHQGDNDGDYLYLLEGELHLSSDSLGIQQISAGDERARFALSNLKPRRFTAIVLSPEALVLHVDGAALEQAIAYGASSREWAGGGGSDAMEVYEFENDEDQAWMMALLSTREFTRLPAANIAPLLRNFERLEVKEGERIIEFGGAGDFYYVMRAGQCRVTRPADDGEVELALLGEGTGFGEEALLSNRPRNATVTMLTDGVLMRLDKHAFVTLMTEPLIRWVDYRESKRLLREGAFKVDVRTEKEHLHNGIKGSINIPLHTVRSKGPILDPSKRYLLFCNNGTRSAAAAFILGQMGLEVYVLRGGISAAVAGRKEQG